MYTTALTIMNEFHYTVDAVAGQPAAMQWVAGSIPALLISINSRTAHNYEPQTWLETNWVTLLNSYESKPPNLLNLRLIPDNKHIRSQVNETLRKFQVQLPERVVVYEQGDVEGMLYRVREKLPQKTECSLLVATSDALLLCQVI